MTKDIYDLFMKHRDIIEMMIAPKRNIFGRRFRITRFKELEDEKLLAIRMDNIFIDNKKIHVNIPRFQRKKVEPHVEEVVRGDQERS